MNPRNISIAVVGPLLGAHPGYVPTQGEQLRELLKKDGHTVYSASSQKNRFLRLLHIIIFLIFGPDTSVVILQVYSGPSFVVEDMVSFIARLQKRYLVMHLHGGNIPDFIRRYPKWTLRVLKRADRLITPSRFLYSAIEVLFGSKSKIIPNLLNFSDYSYKQRGQISPKFLWMRAFHPIYNPEMAVYFFSEIVKNHPDATLVMAGQKGNEEEMKILAQKLGVESKIRFTGFLDEAGKRKEMELADIYINTNRIDNMPVSILESWAFGLPVISANVGGIPYLIEDGKTGLLVDDGDYRAMARKAEELLKSSELTEQLSINGRKKAEESSWGSVRSAWEAVLLQSREEKK